ncbi:putative aldouronate transport system permease protein [Paenibacillus endophyticus]|uniref:Putative aldouronate transport system permease protein n=1 Tax=Paenibacillus endophyticus TaxID=1294268 RepID=A0A7W5C3E9_9BACL|nr:carbohydrate ABC transporter permease [Paenibacillus endophyticus]MBB3150511.1 putative aldouronate transport system permease protein [Paenibacillus endophyticus]
MVKGNSRAVDMMIYVFLAFIAFLSMAPVLNTLAISFSGKIAAMSGEVYFWPVDFNLNAYKSVISDRGFFVSFGVSIKRVLLGGAINFVITILMAYPLSKSGKFFPGRNIYMWFIVFCMLFSGGLIPWYMTIYTFGMLDTIWALVLPTAVPVFNVILLMNFFKGIPKELEDAANIDGAGPWKTLILIFVPVSTPALATVTLFSIVGHWNSFFDGMILMQHKENWPLQTYIQQLIISVNSIMNTTDPEEIKRLSNMSSQLLNAAKVMVSMVPIMLIYPFLQKYFVSGIVLGAVKE